MTGISNDHNIVADEFKISIIYDIHSYLLSLYAMSVCIHMHFCILLLICKLSFV